ncbi:MAG: DinB family protein [Planctomycetes bacterium]|nr:DinB family protein [Planctomycetota bacterium]MCB9910966.1 DinB family protein [Planctomycetota bacterium]MCB9911567.1 DinB family protein [Planctomycetota bacterium]HPF13242.1 DinB family protein [Planctomycetota bacterium]HRV81628.1 DinB family protein [Planctomycetota bacterium]
MNQDLIDPWIAQNKEQTIFVQRLVLGLSSEAVHWNPAERAWSIAQCLGHLNQTARAYSQGIDRALAQGVRVHPGSAPFAPGWVGRKVIQYVGPGGTKALKAPGVFRPEPNPATDGVEDFVRWQGWLINRMGAARLLDLNKNKVPSPALPMLRFKLGECFQILVDHTQRHLHQALVVRSHPDFPGPALEGCSA